MGTHDGPDTRRGAERTSWPEGFRSRFSLQAAVRTSAQAARPAQGHAALLPLTASMAASRFGKIQSQIALGDDDTAWSKRIPSHNIRPDVAATALWETLP